MIPHTPFLQFIAPRIATAQERVKASIWTVAPTHSTPLSVSRAPATFEHRPAEEAVSLAYEPVELIGGEHVWGRKWQQAWWKVTVPPAADKAGRYLLWNDRAEATLYRPDGSNGFTPHYGIDPGHHYAPLPDDLDKGGELLVESVCCRTGVWVHGETQGIEDRGSVFRGAYLATRDEDAWQLWHDMDVLIGVARELEAQVHPHLPHAGAHGTGRWVNSGFREPIELAPPVFRQILHGLNTAVDALETDGLAAARKALRPLFKALSADGHAMRATLTGHAHIDLVWLWPERVGDFKAVHSFATVDSLMRSYPELHFGYSQTASYEAVEKRSPSLMKRVRSRIKSKHWEATGAMYVESDTQMPCGEALLRSIALGQEGFRDLTGGDSQTLWLPDVFGYSACLPQLLQGFGVPYFFTTKLHWSSATKFPHSAFRWQGHDGSEVLGFIAWEHYNLTNSPAELKRASDNQRQSGVFNETLVPVGYGDGGGGPNETMCERARRFADLATMPRCEWGRIDSFFGRMAKVVDDLPTWRGEMYLEYHRGVQTTHGHLKSAYRAAERGLQAHEAAHCVTGRGPIDALAWKRTVFAQFHDYLPGSSVQEVYDEGVPELRRIAEGGRSMATRELGGEGTANVFNPLAIERIELIDGSPRRLPPLAGGPLVELETVAAADVTADDATLANGRVNATFDASGGLIALHVDGEPLALTGPSRLVWFPDFPSAYPAWDIDRPTLAISQPAGEPIDRSSEGDAARRVLGFTYQVTPKSTATVRYILEKASAVLRVEVEVDWQDENTLLKWALPTAYEAEPVRYGAPFGSVTRTQSANTIGDDARFEMPLSRWMAVGDSAGGPGAMLVTENKFGGGVRDGLMHLSLMRTALVTDADSNVPLRDWQAFGGEGHMRHSDLGRQTIRFAVGRFDPVAPRAEQPAALAESLFTPPLPYNGAAASAGLLGLDGCPSLVPTWAKPEADASWTLRLNETLGRRGTATLRLAPGWSAKLINLKGDFIADVVDGKLEVTPHALLSVRISRAGSA